MAHVIEWSPYSFNTNEENAQRHKRREAELNRAHSEIVDPVVEKLQAAGIEAEGVVRQRGDRIGHQDLLREAHDEVLQAKADAARATPRLPSASY